MPDPARTQARDIGRIQERGASAAAVLAGRAFASILRAYRAGERVAFNSIQVVEQLGPMLSDAMLLAWMAGLNRERTDIRRERPGLKLAFSPTFNKAIAFLKARADLTDDELRGLRDQFDANALTVLHTAEAAAEAKLQAAIVESVQEGVHVREGVKKLRSAFEAAGLEPSNSFQLETIFRTQTQLAYNAGRWTADQDPAIQEILWGYEYNTVGDDRVRPAHAALDGFRAAKGDPIWTTLWPPNGFNCRCTTIRIFTDDPWPERVTKLPPTTIDVDGKDVKVGPDKGFAFNAGTAIRAPQWAVDSERTGKVPSGATVAKKIPKKRKKAAKKKPIVAQEAPKAETFTIAGRTFVIPPGQTREQVIQRALGGGGVAPPTPSTAKPKPAPAKKEQAVETIKETDVLQGPNKTQAAAYNKSRREYAAVKKTATKEELTAVRNYAKDEKTPGGYVDMNDMLRDPAKFAAAKGKSEGTKSLTSQNIEQITKMANRMPPTPADMTLFRYQSHDPGFSIGDSASLSGFTSTSVGTPLGAFTEDVMFEINVKKGSKKILRGFNTKEIEALLPHGAKIKVTAIDNVIAGGKNVKRYTLDLVG